MLINIGVSFIVSCRKAEFFCMKMLIYLFILSSDVKLVISSYQWILTYQTTKLIYIYIYIGFVGCGIVAWRTAIVIPDSERFRSSLAAKY